MGTDLGRYWFCAPCEVSWYSADSHCWHCGGPGGSPAKALVAVTPPRETFPRRFSVLGPNR